jgi:pimeloyl-ACP methyl ester carboxylesterase
MTIMALADKEPALFGHRVVGVALVATSTGKLAEVTFGLPAAFSRVNKRVLPFLTRGMQARPEVFDRGRRIGTDLAFLGARRVGFGPEASPAQVEFTEKMIAATPTDVIADFYATLVDHDKLSALPVLRGVETLVLVGSADVLTPPDHSRTIAAQLPDAQLVVVEGAGHMVKHERHALVNLQLRALVRRATNRARRSA